MGEKLKILVIMKHFQKQFPTYQSLYETITELEKQAEIKYWDKDGDIHDILKTLNFLPDFILQYDVAWNHAFSPKVNGLGEVDIPKGCIVIDIHYSPQIRNQYFNDTKIDLIFSLTKSAFLNRFEQYRNKFKWFPFAVNPMIYKDWKMDKKINFLLMGQVHDREGRAIDVPKTPRGKYPFREEVLIKMRDVEGFVFNPHPGQATRSKNAIINEKYAQEINKSKIFFTCGSIYNYPVQKFFEAPACRSLMLAEPADDISELGFKDGHNFVSCNKDNFYEKAMYYLKNEEKRQEITDNGYTFIHQHHTNKERIKRLLQDIQQFIESKKNTS
ncbi:glycosyltransferase [Metabacillus dongyingensis]|uniref:glycosyltransferase family protein n=1 Tax=Metabacillus dongyingensis TaxID=2874282 RepID=UPI001CBF764F|nr:glycosyltransferase [Metabacillus dongyingensis]UAL52924.1 glycosyltransferase [Metabacillus dongyingensis]